MGGNGSTYLEEGVAKTNSEEPDGIILDSDNYDGEINHIGISHERTRTPDEPPKDDGEAILRSELGKLMRIARIARPGAIYDVSAAAQTFSLGGRIFDVLARCGGFWKGRKGSSPK